MKTSKTNAFTLIELLVVISIIAILAGIALPVFGQVQIKGAQTKALSNAKQIATALKLYAVDNSGQFPSYTLKPDGTPDTTSPVSDSNTAFAQLIPDYVPNEDIFWLAKSAFCKAFPNGPDNQIDNPPTSPPNKTLASGENEWAYVLELNDSSNAAMPIIADGFNDKSNHKYIADATQNGGVWQGKASIVVRVDTSAAVMKVSKSGATQFQVVGYNGSTTGNGDIFDNTNGANGWLGTTNIVVNPK
jgi:prepilin-type N-terminal cleavage/methylation domain-containing protein